MIPGKEYVFKQDKLRFIINVHVGNFKSLPLGRQVMRDHGDYLGGWQASISLLTKHNEGQS